MLKAQLYEPGGRPTQVRAHDVVVRRCIMAPASVRVVADAPRDLAHLVLQGASLRACVCGDRTSPLHVPARITVPGWHDERHEHVVLDGITTGMREDGARSAAAADDPRRRVLRAVNLAELFGYLDHVAKLSTAVHNHFAMLRFDDADAQLFIQDGLSDLQLLRALVAQLPLIEPDSRWHRLALVSGSDAAAGTAGRWVLEFADKRALAALGAVDSRTVGEPDGRGTRIEFSTANAHSDQRLTYGGVPTVRETWLSRPFTPELWQEWTERDLPLFLGAPGHLVVSVEDRLTDGGGGEISWSSTLELLPTGTFLCMPPTAPLWHEFHTDRAEVLDAAPDQHHVRVRLAGFEPEDDGDWLDAIVTSPYTGPDGRGGLHLVPHRGTTVQVAWSGRLGEPVVMGDGVRRQPPRLAAPSLELTDAVRAKLAAVHLLSIGALEVDGDMIARMKGVLGVSAGDAILTMQDGMFRTARGSLP